MNVGFFLYSLHACLSSYPQNQTIFVDLYDCKYTKGNICYLSGGSAEDWRSDYKSFPKEALGNKLNGWPHERWLDTRNQGVRAVLAKRLDLAKSKLCRGVDIDNEDGVFNKTGFPLTKADQEDFVKWISSEAHKRGLLVGLKNSSETAKSLSPLVDFHVAEEANKYKEVDKYPANKTFFIEYTKVDTNVCKLRPYTLFADLELKNFKRCP